MYYKHFKKYVLIPTLSEIGLYSHSATELLMGTIAVESGFRYLHQVNGPALGLCQIEPATHDDVYKNFLNFPRYRILGNRVRSLIPAHVINGDGTVEHEQLITNLSYAVAIARVIYYRVKEPLPQADDIAELARYYKTYYNSGNGKGTEQRFVEAYNALAH